MKRMWFLITLLCLFTYHLTAMETKNKISTTIKNNRHIFLETTLCKTMEILMHSIEIKDSRLFIHLAEYLRVVSNKWAATASFKKIKKQQQHILSCKQQLEQLYWSADAQKASTILDDIAHSIRKKKHIRDFFIS